MESLPKVWQSVRHGLYANESTGGHYTRVKRVPNLHASVSYSSSSLLRAVGGLHVITSLCIQKTAKTPNILYGVWSWSIWREQEVGGGVLRFRNVVCLSIHICEYTYSFHQTQGATFAAILLRECDMFPFKYLKVVLKGRINIISPIIMYCRGHLSQFTLFPAVHHEHPLLLIPLSLP